jgi:hypothetical protein
MDLLLAVGVWAVGAWLAYRCTRSASSRADDAGVGPGRSAGPPGGGREGLKG